MDPCSDVFCGHVGCTLSVVFYCRAITAFLEDTPTKKLFNKIYDSVCDPTCLQFNEDYVTAYSGDENCTTFLKPPYVQIFGNVKVCPCARLEELMLSRGQLIV